MQDSTFRIIALCGSLRGTSFNRGLLHAAAELAPPGVQVDIMDLRGVPEFNEDIERLGDPPRVAEIKQQIAAASALLIATPEYNYGLPGWFKNVLDWVSRPAATTPLLHKPIALLSASFGERGGARAQMALRQSLVPLDAYVMARPELFVGNATGKFSNGVLTDEPTRQAVRDLVAALINWATRVADA